MPAAVKRRYFELIRTGLSGSAAAQQVGVSLSCGSLWFIDAGRVNFIETPISPRYLSQDDRIEIADGLARGEPVKLIAARIGKTFQSVYREIARNRKPDGRYQPWYAHNRAYLRRRRPSLHRTSL
jgi:transposase, IS30 family